MNTGTMCLAVAGVLALLLFGSRITRALQSFGEVLMRWMLGAACVVGLVCWWQSSGPSKEGGSASETNLASDPSSPPYTGPVSTNLTGYAAGAGLPEPGMFNPYAAGALDRPATVPHTSEPEAPKDTTPEPQQSAWTWWSEE